MTARRLLFTATCLAWLAGEAALTRRDRRQSTGVIPVEHGQTRLAALSWLALLAGAVAARLPLPRLPGSRASQLSAGTVTMWTGMLLRLWAIRTLGPLFRREIVLQSQHSLVAGGPYAAVRHPGYSGTLAVMAGIGIAEGSVASVALCVGVSAATHVPRIRVEESALAARFPGYDRELPRWRLVPGFW